MEDVKKKEGERKEKGREEWKEMMEVEGIG